MRTFRIWLASIAALLLAACAAPTPKVDLKPGALKPGQTIALVEAPPITHYFMWAAHPGMAFGAIGGLVAGAQFEAQGKEVAQLMQKEGFVPQSEITETFRRELEASGYRVELVRDAWKLDGNLFRLDVKRIPASYDRVIVLTPALLGFYSRGLTGDYAPSLRLRVALYGPDREKPLYDGHHITGLQPPGAGWILVPPVATGFSSYQLMISQPPAMAAALRKGIAAVTRSAMSELAVPGSRPAAVAVAREVGDLSGAWHGTMKCGEYTGTGNVENPKPWTASVRMAIEGGEAVMTRGGADRDYEERIAGTIDATLQLTMQGQGHTHRMPDKPWFTNAGGRFVTANGKTRFAGEALTRTAQGVVTRTCTLQLVRATSA